MTSRVKTILIIDDDHRNIFALKAVLKSRSYNCVTALSAIEGLEVLDTNKNVNIVLLDMMMPGMDGYEALSLMKEKFHLPVISVTAQAMVGDREKCLEAGADDYISKPINVDNLMNVLKRFLNE